MGIFDFLGDLSSKRSKELGLGGLQSLLGTRGAAQAGAIGDEMIGITNKDSLPGYFNEQTREYVPWYVDLFDGGGLNAAGGQTQEEAAKSGAAGATPGGAPMAQPGLLRPRARRDPLEQFGGAGPTIPEGPLGPFGGAGPRISGGDPRQMGGASGYGQTGVSPLDPFGGAGPAIPAQAQAMPAPQQGVLPQMQDNVPMPAPLPRESALNTLRENVYSVGPIDAYRNALNNRPDIPLTQPFAGMDDTPRLSEMQTPMMQHPAFPRFVELMKRQGHESSLQDPRFLQTVFNNYLRLEGL
jgi:hypothetical protein